MGIMEIRTNKPKCNSSGSSKEDKYRTCRVETGKVIIIVQIAIIQITVERNLSLKE